MLKQPQALCEFDRPLCFILLICVHWDQKKKKDPHLMGKKKKIPKIVPKTNKLLLHHLFIIFLYPTLVLVTVTKSALDSEVILKCTAQKKNKCNNQ